MTLAVGGCESSARRPTICNGPPCALFKRYTQAGESKLAHLRVISFIFASLSGGRRLKPHKPSPTFAGRDWQRGRNRIRAETYIQQHTEQRTAVLAILVHGRQCKRQVNGRWDNSSLSTFDRHIALESQGTELNYGQRCLQYSTASRDVRRRVENQFVDSARPILKKILWNKEGLTVAFVCVSARETGDFCEIILQECQRWLYHAA
jgi:hypothetical protein